MKNARREKFLVYVQPGHLERWEELVKRCGGFSPAMNHLLTLYEMIHYSQIPVYKVNEPQTGQTESGNEAADMAVKVEETVEWRF
jgi:hypothetical protein